MYYDNVLTEDDVRLLIDTAIPRFEKSRVVAVDGSVQEDVSRTSESAWIYFSERPQLADIGRKVVALTGFPFTHAEAISVNRYSKTQYFNPHYDFLDEDVLRTDHMFPNCQRAATVLIYLSDVASGGESVFVRKGALDGRFKYDHMNEDHVAVRPKRGRVLIWYDMYPWSEEVDLRTLHGGAPVKEGVKIAATIFVRNCSSLESRQKEEL